MAIPPPAVTTATQTQRPWVWRWVAGRREGQTISQRECERETEQKSNSEEREQKCAKGINSKMKRNSLDVITVKEKKINNRGAPIRIFEADHRLPITESSICRSDHRYRSFYYVELFIVILQSGILDIYSGPEFHFWEWISPLGDSCEGDFLIWGVEGEFFRHFSKIYIYLT